MLYGGIELNVTPTVQHNTSIPFELHRTHVQNHSSSPERTHSLLVRELETFIRSLSGSIKI